MNKGQKNDKDKLEWSLLPVKALEKVIKVQMYGNKKYSKNNWMLLNNLDERFWNAAQRHLWQHKKGEYLDSESGLPHLAHAAASILFILHDHENNNSKVSE